MARVFALRGGHRNRTFLALRDRESPRDLELDGVDLDELVVHHAGRVLPCAARVDAAAVRHRARHDARDFGGVRRVDDRHRGRHHVAVQVEVHRERVQAVRRDVDRRGEVAERECRRRRACRCPSVVLPAACRRAGRGPSSCRGTCRRARSPARAGPPSRSAARRWSIVCSTTVPSGPKRIRWMGVGRFGADVDPVGARRAPGGLRLRLDHGESAKRGCRQQRQRGVRTPVDDPVAGLRSVWHHGRTLERIPMKVARRTQAVMFVVAVAGAMVSLDRWVPVHGQAAAGQAATAVPVAKLVAEPASLDDADGRIGRPQGHGVRRRRQADSRCGRARQPAAPDRRRSPTARSPAFAPARSPRRRSPPARPARRRSRSRSR